MAESNTKIFTVNAEAASTIGGTRRRKKRTTDKTMKIAKEQHGGTSSGTVLQVRANEAPGAPDFIPSNFQKSTDVALAKTTTESSPAAVLKGGAATAAAKPPINNTKIEPLSQEGGAKAVKVILEKKKKQTRVVLAPTKVKKLPGAPAGQPAKTRKVAKKVRMSLSGFGKRVTRANTIRHEAKKQTIDQIKKTLVEAKLVKGDSKAPEGVLRQIYSDYMMLKNRAL